MRLLTSKFLSLAPCRVTSIVYILADPGGGGGALGYLLGGHVPPGTPNWHPVLKKFPLKLIPRSRIRPKTDTPF